MARYIDADKLKAHYAWWGDTEERRTFDEIVDAQPTADVQEVKHGKWKEETNDYECIICATEFTCSVCYKTFCLSELTDKEFYEMMKHCPNCGAKMDGEEIENERV